MSLLRPTLTVARRGRRGRHRRDRRLPAAGRRPHRRPLPSPARAVGGGQPGHRLRDRAGHTRSEPRPMAPSCSQAWWVARSTWWCAIPTASARATRSCGRSSSTGAIPSPGASRWARQEPVFTSVPVSATTTSIPPGCSSAAAPLGCTSCRTVTRHRRRRTRVRRPPGDRRRGPPRSCATHGRPSGARRTGPPTDGRHVRGCRHDEAAVGGRGPFRPSDSALEPEDEAIHLRRAQRHLHHRSPADAGAHRDGVQVRARHRRRRRLDPLRGHQEADPGSGGALRGQMRNAVHQRALARRHAHQLPDDQLPREEDAGVRVDAGGR